MYKKMKGVSVESSIYGSCEAKFKHQSLIKDYQELEKESEKAKNNMEVMNQRRFTLLAEVRFLRQRYKYLLEMKEGQNLFQRRILQIRNKSSTNEKKGSKKEAKLESEVLIQDLKIKKMSSTSKKNAFKTKVSFIYQKEKKNNGNEAYLGSKNLGFKLKHKKRKYGEKKVTFRHPSEVFRLKKLNIGNKTNAKTKNLDFDLNRMEISYNVRDEAVRNLAPMFDLNLKLGEEDLQESYEVSRSEEQKNKLGDGNQEQFNDLKLSIFRNDENEKTHSGKRKISWQEPVALKP